jgi:hypothetical protein
LNSSIFVLQTLFELAVFIYQFLNVQIDSRFALLAHTNVLLQLFDLAL